MLPRRDARKIFPLVFNAQFEFFKKFSTEVVEMVEVKSQEFSFIRVGSSDELFVDELLVVKVLLGKISESVMLDFSFGM